MYLPDNKPAFALWRAAKRRKSYQSPAAYGLLVRNFEPYFQSTGVEKAPIARDTMASRLFPNPYPRPSYIAGAKRGNAKPVMLLATFIVEMAEAAYRG